MRPTCPSRAGITLLALAMMVQLAATAAGNIKVAPRAEPPRLQHNGTVYPQHLTLWHNMTLARNQTRQLQATQQLCHISSLFNLLTDITTNPACRAGCAGGSGVCGEEWYPGAADACSKECGRIFETFWDECGDMLVNANMGGMEGMGTFYDHCVESLYPPGTCGAFCNQVIWQKHCKGCHPKHRVLDR